MLPKNTIKRIDDKLLILKSKRPLSHSLVKKLKDQFSLELTYNSNAIEGNKLSLKETHLVINHGLTVKGKSMHDHLEAKNHYDAVHFLYDVVDSQKKQRISEQLIRSLQHLVVKDLEDDDAGKYRQGNVMITGSKHTPPDAFEVPLMMQEFIRWTTKNSNKLHPVELAALSHHKLVNIHPFTDGNGRTARLFMNLILMQQGYPMVVILKNDRKRYYRALEKADGGQFEEIEKFIAQAVDRSLNMYLNAFSSSSNKTEKFIPLSKLATHSTFSEKYLNLLARSGKLEAHKNGRIWLSTQQALENYLIQRERKRKNNKN